MAKPVLVAKPKPAPVMVEQKPAPVVQAIKPVEKPAKAASPAIQSVPAEGSIDDLEAYVAKAQKLLQVKKAEADKAAKKKEEEARVAKERAEKARKEQAALA